MSEEELRKEATTTVEWECTPMIDRPTFVNGYITSAKLREKQIAELEKEISILLSCKNCPENKGGFICQKEYEDKCLAQKIQYVKELLEENAELKSGCGMCYRKDKEQLTKAKKIIKKLYPYVFQGMDFMELNDYNVQKAEVEQFLKEQEND